MSIGLSGLLALGLSIVNAADTVPRLPNVLHEMVPHVVLPETVQYNKTAKNTPGTGYTGVNSPYVATYVAYPSYQVPPTAAFRPVGQSVYPVSPQLLPAPLPKEQNEQLEAPAEEQFVLTGRDVNLSDKMSEPIQLAAVAEEVVPTLPKPTGTVQQTGMFCQHPASPPSAWAFSSPLFKAASVPAGWGGGNMGSINHHSPRGSGQHIGFQSGGVAGVAPVADGSVAAAQGVPYSTFQMGHQAPEQVGPQAQVLPNGMVLLTLPPNHNNCGLLRCRSGHSPQTMLLPPAGYNFPQQSPQAMMMPGNFDMPYMQVSGQPQMMPQMQTAPMMVMTPMGPAIVGQQQMPMMNPMSMMNPQFSPMQQMPMATMAMPNPMVAAQATVAADADATDEEPTQTPPPVANPMALVATPFGYYAVQTSADAAQNDAAVQLAQSQALLQSQMATVNPYAGLYATPFGYIAMNPAGQFGGYGMPMMNAGYQQPGMPFGMMNGGQGMTVSDMLQIMTFLNQNKSQQRRARLAERLAERRERRTAGNDPFAQLMQAWSTPYVAPDTALRMPARNAYPYGYFGAQALPMDTANYGGYHNLYFGSTAYPGLY